MYSYEKTTDLDKLGTKSTVMIPILLHSLAASYYELSRSFLDPGLWPRGEYTVPGAMRVELNVSRSANYDI